MSNFDDNLKDGKLGESQIADWLKRRGHHILPVYEIEKGQYAGPALYTSTGDKLVAPDLLVFGKGKVTWIEAKHKSGFTWHRKTQRETTGIDLHHYFHYRRIIELVDWPVWLLFLHKGLTAKDSLKSEAGLFGNDLYFLMRNENHRHLNHGKTGMVYWAKDKLKKLSNYPLS